MLRTISTLALVLFLITAGCTATKKAASPALSTASKAAGNDDDKDKSKDKKYSDIITDEAESDEGLFDLHKVADKYYFEIPDSLFGAEMLLVSRRSKTADNIGYGGEKENTLAVRWEKMDKKVLFRVVSYENVATEDQPIFEAVRNANFEPIIHSFEVATIGEDSTSTVIDATPLFTTDIAPLGLSKSRRDRFKVRRLDAKRTFISAAKSFPQNIEVRSVLTYEATEPPSNSSTGTISLEMNHSMILLPAVPMQPRIADSRVGFFSVSQTDYGLEEHRAKRRTFITRWKLEPKDPAAYARGELVEPVKPIVYYIDPATPKVWRPYIKQGVDDWQSAFEQAGFKNAIMAKDPPTPEEDPEFSPEDVRYSVIRYFPSDIQNAYGPHVHDPRSGEILESDIGWFHNVMNLLRNWYFVQTAAINPAARSVKFADEVMGQLIRFVSAHEVGHTLGLPHNMKASSSYPVDSLRSPTFTKKYGTAPAIMDYARFNYVAQPEDGDVALMPNIGVYDKYAIEWGYRWIPDATSAEDEKETLNSWIIAHEDDPMYRFGDPSRMDPGSQTEDLGDDSIKASEYGIENLKRIVPNLVDWTTEIGGDFSDLNELYSNVAGQWNRYVGHVATNIGGVYRNRKAAGQDGVIFNPVPAERQRRAMAFMDEHVFTTPTWMIDHDILLQLDGPNMVDRIGSLQARALSMILDPEKMQRLTEVEAMDSNDERYTLSDMLSDLRQSVWAELYNRSNTDVYRRGLHRAWVDRMSYLMTAEISPPPAFIRNYLGATSVDMSQSDIRAFVRGELEDIQRLAETRSRSGDRASRLHLRDIAARIEKVLDPKG